MLRAIDIQHVLVQSNSMERVQQTQQQHPDQQQRYLDIQGKEEKKLSKESVKNTDEPDHARVQEKKEHEGSKRQLGEHPGKQEQNQKQAEPEKKPEEDEQGGIIDILA